MKRPTVQRSSGLITSKPRKRVSQRLSSSIGDERLAKDFERILESEHELRLKYMSLRNFTYDEAVAAFEKAKHEAVVALIASAEALVGDDPSLDPDGQHDPHEVAVWYIHIPAWGGTQYVATEVEAEEWRRDKARAERAAGATKRRHTGTTPQELARYAEVGPHHLE